MTKKLAVVMAAGKGTRMKSDLPKVLCQVRGRAMLDYVLDALSSGGITRSLVVVGYRADLVRESLQDRTNVDFADQTEQLGTGHAVMSCRDHLADHDGPVVVVAGDSPMMRGESIEALLKEYERTGAACILGSAHKENPFGLGRVVRDADGQFQAIVEEKDATEEQRKVTEVNMSYYVFNCQDLLGVLDELRTDNSQGEYYITDAPAALMKQGKDVRALPVLHPSEALGINTVEELAAVEEAWEELAGECAG